jgi:hypothetical protein
MTISKFGPTDYKYAGLSFDLPFPTFKDPIQPIELTPGLWISVKSNTMNLDDSNFWKAELGRGAWEDIQKDGSLLLSCETKSNNPDVVDNENEELKNRTINAFRVLPIISEIRGPFSFPQVYSGRGRTLFGTLQPEDVRSVSRIEPWIRSFYQDGEFWDSYHNRYSITLEAGDFFDSWRNVLEQFESHVFVKDGIEQIIHSFSSLEESYKALDLSFKIPLLMRSMESILANYGKPEFIERYIYLLNPNPLQFGYPVIDDLSVALGDFVELRNDCVHGKPMGYSFKKKYGVDLDATTVAKLEYLGEWGAKRTLLGCFRNVSMQPHLKSFYALEAAWKSKKIEPHDDYISDVV